MSLFRNCLKRLEEVNCAVIVRDGHYMVQKQEQDLNKIITKISCADPQKEKKLLDCYYELRG
jgi:hypothetical protein